MISQTYLDHASRIGYQLYREAIWHDERCNWISKEYDPADGGRSFHFQPMQGDFYKGLPGTALFFAGLFRETNEKRFRKAAIGACQQALRLSSQILPGYRTSFFRGWTGQIWTSCLVAKLCDAPSLTEAAMRLLTDLLKEETSGAKIDVIDGVAGGLPVLLALDTVFPQQGIRGKIDELGAYLIQQAITRAEGSYWKTHLNEEDALPGFSHGSSGIAWCLFELYTHTQEEVYLQHAIAALQYEKSHLLAAKAEQEADSLWVKKDWAHGSAGLAMTQWKAFQTTARIGYLEEARRLTEESWEAHLKLPFLDVSVCNGFWGLSDALLLAHQNDAGTGQLARMEQLLELAIDQWKKMGQLWINGINSQEEVPDFMISLSGIGYGFLRLHNAQRYPSVLAIQQSEMVHAFQNT